MGLDVLQSLALGLSLFPLHAVPNKGNGSDSDGGPITLRELWEHSVGCAAVAARIATQVDHVSPLQAFAAGFLHDIGRLLLYRCSREAFGTAINLASVKSVPLSEAETLAVGLNHMDLGEIWAGRVKLSQSFQQVMRYHHDPACMLPETMNVEWRALIAVVQLADLICESRAIGWGGDPAIVPAQLWRDLDLREERWSDQFDAIKREITAARQIFGFAKEEAKKRQRTSPPRFKKKRQLISNRQKTAVNEVRNRVIVLPPRNQSYLRIPIDTST
jgi:HD-like signal output (HDOD) protein